MRKTTAGLGTETLFLARALLITIILSLSASAGIEIIVNSNILLGENAVLFSIDANNPFNGSISVISSGNIAAPSEITFSDSEFSYSSGIYSISKSRIFTATAQGDYFITATLFNGTSSLESAFKAGKVLLSLDISPPEIVSVYPSNTLNSTKIQIAITTNENSTCRGSFSDIDKSYELMEAELLGAGQKHYYNATLSEGSMEFFVKCADSYNNTMPQSYSVPITIDTTPPIITDFSPRSAVVSSYATLTVITSEESECRQSRENGTYLLMSPMHTDNRITHSYQMEGLSEGNYNYYISCTDLYGNRMAENYTIRFEVSLPPSARVEISKSSPLKEGVYEVTLTTSKNVQSTPILNYQLGSSSAYPIPLSGSGNIWNGFMIIEGDRGNQVGSFSFSATDYWGITGSIIKEGKVFLVDTIKPPTPVIEAFSASDGSIRLSWRYDGEEVKGFRIYRSTSSGVSLLNFYANSSGNSYADTNVASGTTYYYAVSAVDKADNEGALSAESYAISTKSSNKGNSTLSPTILKKIDDAINLADSSMQKILAREKNLLEKGDKALMEKIGLLKDVEDAKSRLESIYSELNQLKSKSANEEELKSNLARQELSIKSIEKSVPIDIRTENMNEFGVQAGSEDIAEAISKARSEYASDLEYMSETSELQGIFFTRIKPVSLSVIYESSTEEYTLVSETLSFSRAVNNSEIVVIIPKSVAEDSSMLEFLTPGYQIIENDPIISWKYSSISEGEKLEIAFYIKEKTGESELSGIKTILLTEGKDKKTSPLTGNSVFNSIKGNAKYAGIIIGVIIVGLLLAYYFRIGRNREDDIDDIIESTLPKSSELEKGLNEESRPYSYASDYSFSGKNLIGQADERALIISSLPLDGLNEDSKKIVRDKSELLKKNSARALPREPKEKISDDEPLNEKDFLRLYNGMVLKNVSELENALESMDSETFNYHVNFEKNDFSIWLKKSLNDRRLAAEMERVRSREEALSVLRNRGEC
ncbi:MAG: hypothetical protein NTV63_04150 [Candidatus Woesearchaeota archaeon]|nr:hypothetical protein [Candidatus Woesearchaeota archaeon]